MTGPVLSKDEISTLLTAISETTVVPLDFSTVGRFTSADLDILHRLHDPFVAALRDLMAEILKRSPKLRLESIGQQPAGVIRAATETAASVRMTPQGALLALDAGAVFPLVERMLGATGEPGTPPARPLGALEQELLGPVLDRMLELAGRTWDRPFSGAAPEWVESWEPAILLTLSAEVGHVRGSIRFAVPSILADRLLRRNAVPATGEIEVTVRLPKQVLRLADLLSMRCGDLLVTRHPESSPVILDAPGGAVLAGRIGASGDHKAFQAAASAVPAEGGRLSVRAGRKQRRGPAPIVPLEVRGILAEMILTAADVAELRPGGILRFQVPVGSPARMKIGPRQVGSGIVVRSGDHPAILLA